VMLPLVGLALGVLRLLRRVARRLARVGARRLRLAAGLAIFAGLAVAWPVLLWGPDPELQTHPAQASTGQHADHIATRSPQVHHAPSSSTVNTTPTFAAPPSA